MSTDDILNLEDRNIYRFCGASIDPTPTSVSIWIFSIFGTICPPLNLSWRDIKLAELNCGYNATLCKQSLMACSYLGSYHMLIQAMLTCLLSKWLLSQIHSSKLQVLPVWSPLRQCPPSWIFVKILPLQNIKEAASFWENLHPQSLCIIKV